MLKIPDLKANPADQSAYYQNQAVYMLDRISQQFASMGDQISTISSSPLPYPIFRPSVSDRRVNTLWLLSLVCSLFAAFLATLVQQWSKAYMHTFQQANNSLQIARFACICLKVPNAYQYWRRLYSDLSTSLSYFSFGDLVTSSCKSTHPFLSSSWFTSLSA